MHIAKTLQCCFIVDSECNTTSQNKTVDIIKIFQPELNFQIFNKVPVRNKLPRKITLKVWRLVEKVKFPISVNNQPNFITFSAVIGSVMTF